MDRFRRIEDTRSTMRMGVTSYPSIVDHSPLPPLLITALHKTWVAATRVHTTLPRQPLATTPPVNVSSLLPLVTPLLRMDLALPLPPHPLPSRTMPRSTRQPPCTPLIPRRLTTPRCTTALASKRYITSLPILPSSTLLVAPTPLQVPRHPRTAARTACTTAPTPHRATRPLVQVRPE